jgi:hypothetical protein
VFYGQQLHFFMTRWQGSDGAQVSAKCKEFPGQLLTMRVPVVDIRPVGREVE